MIPKRFALAYGILVSGCWKQATSSRNKAKMRKLLSALLLIATLTGCGGAPTMERKLIIFHAGSLTVPFKELSEAFMTIHPGVIVETEGAGSRTTVRKVTELGREADIIGVSDYTVIEDLMFPDYADWYIRFARNRIVIAYLEDRARYAEEINSENWYEIITREGVRYGRSDPDADPCGYRTLMVWQLAEKHYGVPGLYEELYEGSPPENIRPKEVELLALLEAGELDYAFVYSSIAEQHGFDFVELPPQIDLSSVEFAEFYAQAKVELSGKEPGRVIIKEGKPIVYGVTIPKNAPHPEIAIAFIEFLIGPEGRRIMASLGQPPIFPAIASKKEKVPEELHYLLTSR
jgi:molybdate/tungstate transport system substrate-binding protein